LRYASAKRPGSCEGTALRAQLALADSHVAQAVQIISRQKKIVLKLTGGGIPTALALEVLETMLSVYEVFLEDRRIIKSGFVRKLVDNCRSKKLSRR
jgi:hypothetical protein